MTNWMTTRPLDDELAQAASALILALDRFQREARPYLRAAEDRTLNEAGRIAASLPNDTENR